MIDRLHGDRVDHLLMELRVELGGRQTLAGEDESFIEVDGRVKTAARRVVVDDLEVSPYRPDHSGRVQAGNTGWIIFPRYGEDQFVEFGRVMCRGNTRIDSVDTQFAVRRFTASRHLAPNPIKTDRASNSTNV